MAELHPWIAPPIDGTFLATFPAERSDEDTLTFWDDLERYFDAGGAPDRFAVILDLSHIRSSSNRARARMAVHLRRYDAYHARHCVGLAVVVRSRVARGAVQALSWMVPHRAAPMKVFSAVAEADVWVRELWRREPVGLGAVPSSAGRRLHSARGPASNER